MVHGDEVAFAKCLAVVIPRGRRNLRVAEFHVLRRIGLALLAEVLPRGLDAVMEALTLNILKALRRRIPAALASRPVALTLTRPITLTLSLTLTLTRGVTLTLALRISLSLRIGLWCGQRAAR